MCLCDPGFERSVPVCPGLGIGAVQTQPVTTGEPSGDGGLPGSRRTADPQDVLHESNRMAPLVFGETKPASADELA
jgi:hypothetical protein